MGARKAIWITRSEPGAEETAERVRALGFEPVVAPLLQIQSIEGVDIDLHGVAALAFTSANGVRAFAERCSERELKVFAVGDATAQAARVARFRTVLSTRGDVASLAAGIAARRRELSGVILHPGAAEPAGDLKGALAKRGIEVRSLPLYESVAAEVAPEVLCRMPRLHGVLLHSPKAARALAVLLKIHPAPQLRVWCLSRAVARPLGRAAVAEVRAAAAPREEALLGLVN